jgi:hypothetical protein
MKAIDLFSASLLERYSIGVIVRRLSAFQAKLAELSIRSCADFVF